MRIKDTSLTKENIADIESHDKTLAELGKSMSKKYSSLFNFGNNIKLLTINVPDFSRFVQQPDPIAFVPNIEARPTAKQQRELLRLSMTISEVNGGHNRSSTSVSYPAYHRRMNSITSPFRIC